MILSNCLLLSTLMVQTAFGHPPLPTTCPIGKICPWGWGSVYRIYENYPNLTVQGDYYKGGVTFEVSQTVGRGEDYKDNKHAKVPHGRVYTVMNMMFSGFGYNGCTLDFNIPCNSTVPFYHHGNALIAARALKSFPSTPPTWNNIIPLIEPEVLGTYGGPGSKPWKRNTFEKFTGNVCGSVGNGSQGISSLSFVYSVDESVKETAWVKWNETLINADIVVGVYVDFVC